MAQSTHLEFDTEGLVKPFRLVCSGSQVDLSKLVGCGGQVNLFRLLGSGNSHLIQTCLLWQPSQSV